MKEENEIKKIMKENIDDYVDFFDFWTNVDKKSLEKSIIKTINNLDLSLYINECVKNKKDLLNGKLSIKKNVEINENTIDALGVNFKNELKEKFLKKNDDKILFEKVYKEYFNLFSNKELLLNKDKNGRKISKGLKRIVISEETKRIFQDCYSEIIQENNLTQKQNIVIEASIKPIDFLTMSYNGDGGWTTCQNIINGEKGLGPLEYITDNSSIIIQAYVESESNNFIKKKIWRTLGFLSKDKNVLTLSTEYPCQNNLLRDEAISLFKKDNSIFKRLKLVESDSDFLSFNTENNNFNYYGDDDVSFSDYKAGNFTREGVPTLFINEEKEFKIDICKTSIDVNDNLPFDFDYYLTEATLSPTIGLLTQDLIIENLEV